MKKLIASLAVASAMIVTVPTAHAQTTSAPQATNTVTPTEFGLWDLLKFASPETHAMLTTLFGTGSGVGMGPGKVGSAGSTVGVVCGVTGSVLSVASLGGSVGAACRPLQASLGEL